MTMRKEIECNSCGIVRRAGGVSLDDAKLYTTGWGTLTIEHSGVDTATIVQHLCPACVEKALPNWKQRLGIR